MQKVGLAVIFIIRAIAILVGIWQVLGLLPLTSTSGPESLPTGLWIVVFIKSAIFFICAGLFFGLGRLRRKLLPSGLTRADVKRDRKVTAMVEEFKRNELEFEKSVAARLNKPPETA